MLRGAPAGTWATCPLLASPMTQAHAPLVQTQRGPVLGTREVEVDPRQNVTVSWTAYYVATPPPLYLPPSPGPAVRRPAHRGPQVPSAPAWPGLGVHQVTRGVARCH